MNCVEQTNKEYSCSAKAMVVKRLDDGRFFLPVEKGDHMHVVNEAATVADELKLLMVEIVKKVSISTSGRSNKIHQTRNGRIICMINC